MSIKNSLRCVLRFSLVVHGSIYGRLRVLLQTVFSLYIRFTKANPRAQTWKYVYDILVNERLSVSHAGQKTSVQGTEGSQRKFH